MIFALTVGVLTFISLIFYEVIRANVDREILTPFIKFILFVLISTTVVFAAQIILTLIFGTMQVAF
jgi:hypothetical protein